MLKNNLTKTFFVFALAFSPVEISPASQPQVTLWNVGQGQWITFSLPHLCLHIDSGGEKFPWPSLLQRCKNKKNYVAFTHLDNDHINATRYYSFKKLNACSLSPLLPKGRHHIQTACPSPNWIGDWRWYIPKCHRQNCSRNDLSQIFWYFGILISGDSPQAQEGIWRQKFKNLKTRAWVLGHHGSRTSTALPTLTSIRPQMALVSARAAKYGHPHMQTQKTTRQAGVPLLRTEDWGHIHLEL